MSPAAVAPPAANGHRLEAFGFDPDHHNGSAEWLIVAGLLVVSVAFAATGRIEWRRAATA